MPYKCKWTFCKPYDEVFEGIKTTIDSFKTDECPWKVTKIEDNILKAVRVSRLGWVDDIKITLSIDSKQPPVTSVYFSSDNLEGLSDWGQNRRNSLHLYQSLPWTPKAYSDDLKVEVPETLQPIVKAMLDPKTGICVKDRVWHFRTYPRCFVGQELVDWMVKYHVENGLMADCSRKLATEIAQELMDNRVFGHVVDNKEFIDGEFFYRFQVKVSMPEEEGESETEEGTYQELQRSSTITAQQSAKFNDAIYFKLKDPANGLPTEDKTFLFMKFQNVFKGEDAVCWMMKNLEVARQQAREICAQLLKEKLISHCSTDLLPFTESCFYKFVK